MYDLPLSLLLVAAGAGGLLRSRWYVDCLATVAVLGTIAHTITAAVAIAMLLPVAAKLESELKTSGSFLAGPAQLLVFLYDAIPWSLLPALLWTALGLPRLKPIVESLWRLWA